MKKAMYVWNITLSRPREGSVYMQNWHLTVVAPDAAEAMRMAVEKNPGAQVWSVQHTGSGNQLLTPWGNFEAAP